MTLTSEQIERYSRQIITPRIGGLAQERLLDSRLIIVGETPHLEPVLSYMTGAGVGRIDLAVPMESGAVAGLARSMKELNADVTLGRLGDSPERPDLALAIITGAASLSDARLLLERCPGVGWVMARLDTPSRLAILPAVPPCPRCANTKLLSDFGAMATNGAIVAMAAAVEAFKLLARYDPQPRPTLIEFDGYRSRGLEITPGTFCGCAKVGG